jgi:hypothetical protein
MVEELLKGKRIDCPPLGQMNIIFKKAGRRKPTTTISQHDFSVWVLWE